MNNKLYQIKDLSFSYQMGGIEVQALKGITCDIYQNTLTTLLGPSGSGKSTLLNILGLIEPFTEGDLLFRETSFKELSEYQKNQIRKYEIGFIFQQFHLIPVLTAQENVSYFLKRQHLTSSEINDRTEEVLTAVGLWEHRLKRPNQLSGGQQQRLSIARALAKKPKVIIGDEPTANLDQKNGHEIMGIFSSLVEKSGLSIILTTHDAMVQSYATQHVHIQDGQLISKEGA